VLELGDHARHSLGAISHLTPSEGQVDATGTQTRVRGPICHLLALVGLPPAIYDMIVHTSSAMSSNEKPRPDIVARPGQLAAHRLNLTVKY
jgi:hypothetical protein